MLKSLIVLTQMCSQGFQRLRSSSPASSTVQIQGTEGDSEIVHHGGQGQNEPHDDVHEEVRLLLVSFGVYSYWFEMLKCVKGCMSKKICQGFHVTMCLIILMVCCGTLSQPIKIVPGITSFFNNNNNNNSQSVFFIFVFHLV